jgi:hypothetical protein
MRLWDDLKMIDEEDLFSSPLKTYRWVGIGEVSGNPDRLSPVANHSD